MIYLDYNATTPVPQDVVEAMLPWLSERFGNPSSKSRVGNDARRAIDCAREELARLLGTAPASVVFTSGATESINTTLFSVVKKNGIKSRNHIITTSVEHSATLTCCKHLEDFYGVDVTYLPVTGAGELDLDLLRASIRPNTSLVSVIWGNNETGVVLPSRRIAEICNECGVPLHLDGVQVVGKIPISFDDLGASYLSISGHKFGAPKGVGALLVKDEQSLVPLIHGGKQQMGLRGGTENVPSIVGLGKAAQLLGNAEQGRWKLAEQVRDEFEEMISNRLPDVRINGQASSRLPNTSNVYIPGVDSDALVTYLDQKGICVSSGSACLEDAITPSHVIFAMGQSYERASESVRVSLCPESTIAELENLVHEIVLFRGFC